jgi:hypothetical protein
MHAIYRFNIAQAIPLDGSATYAEIAAATGQHETLIVRVIRQAMTNYIFDESSPGRVCHTAYSRLIATSSDFRDLCGMQLEELSPAGQKYIEAVEKFGDSSEPNETAFSLANGGTQSIFDILGEHPERARRLDRAMHYFTSESSWDIRYLLAAFDWKSVDHPGIVIVDVGGGQGQVASVLAQGTEHIKYIVQDLPHVATAASQDVTLLSPEVKDRVEFMAQDFLQPQTMPAPDVFLLRWVLHNWSDKYVIKILKNLIPSMKKGTILLINEFILENEPTREATQKLGPRLDMLMAACFNGRERTDKDFQNILLEADKRFVWKGTRCPSGSSLSVVEVVWETEES